MSGKQLYCNQRKRFFDYEIMHGFHPLRIIDADEQWELERRKIVKQLFEEHPTDAKDSAKIGSLLTEYNIEDWHWNWSRKALSCFDKEYEWVYLMAEGKIQAICIIYHPIKSRLMHDNIFYVDYLATAYWNRPRPNYQRQFNKAGSLLLSHSIRLLVSLNYRPGFCLHSLPGAEKYYLRIGMNDLGIDPTKENLKYFEASQTCSVAVMEMTNG